MRRCAISIDYFPVHCRIGLYEELARRMDTDFVFFSDERERWHNPAIEAAGWATTGGWSLRGCGSPVNR